MTRIFRDQDMVTLINVFTVAPKDQQRLVDLLVEATKEVISKQPGYVSAKLFTEASTARGSPTTRSGVAGKSSRRYSATRMSPSTCVRRRSSPSPTNYTFTRSPLHK